MKKSVLIVLALLGLQGQAQKNKAPFEKPKLVVGIVVDQMRYEYINRFWDKYGEGGFKRLVNNGFSCKNNHFNYVPTYTGPGHASVYTGTTPRVHGIIANDWYDKVDKTSVYCAGDPNTTPVGTTDNSGKMSPHRLKTGTIGDALKLFTQNKSKVIGISMKDRGAIFPAGHMANAAYWFREDNEGNWISSSYYMNELPNWVQKFNQSRVVDQYKKIWTTLYPIETYTESRSDDNDFEGPFDGEQRPVFPHDLPKLWNENKKYSILKKTPFGNSLTTDFAFAAIDGEQLGKDDITDLLAISYSCTDYVGHKFGVNSKEIEDTYLRLDIEIERLLQYLDRKVGKGNYTLFLTADHGAGYVGSYLQSLKMPADYFDYNAFTEKLNRFLTEELGIQNLIEDISNDQIYYNHEVVKSIPKFEEKEQQLVQWILNYSKVDEVYTAQQMRTGNYDKNIPNFIQNGFNHKRSGDLILALFNDVVSYSKTGSTHGSGFSYDTQVPLVFYGKGIRHGSTFERTEITDIAPTISALLGIPMTNGCTGNPIVKVVEN